MSLRTSSETAPSPKFWSSTTWVCPRPALKSLRGGVKSGEELEEAVLREVAEETGLLTATVVRQIAVESKPRPDSGQPRRTTFFFLRASAETPDAWDHHVNGDGDDAGLTFTCRFLPLPLKRPLADDQDAWLGNIDPRWTTVTGDSQ